MIHTISPTESVKMKLLVPLRSVHLQMGRGSFICIHDLHTNHPPAPHTCTQIWQGQTTDPLAEDRDGVYQPQISCIKTMPSTLWISPSCVWIVSGLFQSRGVHPIYKMLHTHPTSPLPPVASVKAVAVATFFCSWHTILYSEFPWHTNVQTGNNARASV